MLIPEILTCKVSGTLSRGIANIYAVGTDFTSHN